MIVMTPSERHHSPTFDHIQISIEDQETDVPSGTWMPITYKGKEYGSIYRSADNVIQVLRTIIDMGSCRSLSLVRFGPCFFCSDTLHIPRRP